MFQARRWTLVAVASLACITATASSAALTPYSQNFESLDKLNPNALAQNNWLVYGNVFDDTTLVRLYGYGPFPAPNGSGAFCAIDALQGGPDQGQLQLSVYSDYNNLNAQTAGDIVESNVFQEQSIGAADVGKVYYFEFDAKRGNLGGSSTAKVFIKTLNPNSGYALTNFLTKDMTSIPTTWGRYMVGILIDASLNGQILQFGFLNTARLFESSGVFYDNVVFRPGTASDAPAYTQAFALRQNVPNPFNPATRIDFDLTFPDVVEVSVYDATGRRVAVLLQDQLDPGPHSVTWNGRTSGGMRAAAGIYRYVLRTSRGVKSRSMVLIK